MIQFTRLFSGLALLLAAGLLVLPSCGGGDSGDGPSTGVTYSELEFDPGNICTKKGTLNTLTSCKYTFNKGQVLPGGSSVFDLKMINTGKRNMEVLGVELEYTTPSGAVEAIPAFALTLPAEVQTALDAGESFIVAPVSEPSEDYAEAIQLRVTFTRYDDQFVRSAKLRVNVDSKAVNVDNGEVLVDLKVSEGAPEIKVTPEILDFGQVFVGEAPSKNVTMLNVGSSNLVITGFTLTGNPNFTVVVAGQDYPVSAETENGITFESPVELAPTSTFFFKVKFAPIDDQKADGALVIYSNDPSKESGTEVLLKGNQTGPCISVNPAKVKFGGKKIGDLATYPIEISSCGDAPLEIFSIAFKPESSEDFGVDTGTLDHEPMEEDPVAIPVGGKVTVNVNFTPDVENPTDPDGNPIPDLGTLVIKNNSFYQNKEIEVSGFGALVICPSAIIECDQGNEVIPQTVLKLHGENSYAESGTISRWLWEVEQPTGSQSVFLPTNSFPSPEFEVNVAGKYTFYLSVWDEQNVESCIKDQFEVTVIPDEAIHIELLWVTPGDEDETDEGDKAGSDLDLHFTHPFATMTDVDGDGKPDPWFDQPYDAFWFNAHPNWGSWDPNVDDDPGLDRDDTDGAGPENINLNIPENNTIYSVGVHYWNNHGYGDAKATVRVYIYSQLVFEISDVLLSELDMWEVATVAWPSGKVQSVVNGTGQYKITSNYQGPFMNE
jgi:hypothetical protein